MTERTALYAGSFDPLTNGHLDVLKASLAVADIVYAAIGIHPGKKPLFSFEERVQLIEAATGYHRWSRRFDRALEDIFAIQDEIAESVATSMRADILRDETCGQSRNDRQATQGSH